MPLLYLIQETMKLANTLRDQAVRQGKFKTPNQESSGGQKRKWENHQNKPNPAPIQQDQEREACMQGLFPSITSAIIIISALVRTPVVRNEIA